MYLKAPLGLTRWERSNRPFPVSQAESGAKVGHNIRGSVGKILVEVAGETNRLARDGAKFGITPPSIYSVTSSSVLALLGGDDSHICGGGVGGDFNLRQQDLLISFISDFVSSSSSAPLSSGCLQRI